MMLQAHDNDSQISDVDFLQARRYNNEQLMRHDEDPTRRWTWREIPNPAMQK